MDYKKGGELVRSFRKKSRTQLRIENNLGIIQADRTSSKVNLFRNPILEEYDKYYEGRQYDHLINWEEAIKSDEYIPIRDRTPRIRYNLGHRIAGQLGGKFTGERVFPRLKIEGDPDTEDFMRLIMQASGVRTSLVEPMRRMVAHGSVFVRFYVVDSTIKIEHFKTKYCYPILDEVGELEELTVKYVYQDTEDLDEKGKPKNKWYKMTLTKTSDVIFDNPEYVGGVNPYFEEVERVDHNFGFVQGVWFRTVEDRHSPDGFSILCDARDFIDEINYSLSQSSQAISYSQEPQLGIKGMDIAEIDELIRSSTKAWNLGRDGSAAYVETNMGGVTVAQEIRDKVRLAVQDVSRIILMDPEKMVSHAQSAKALEVLHGPMLDLIEELRPMVEKGLISLVTKMMVTILALEARGQNLVMSIPKGYVPTSLNITADWPDVFPQTMADLQAKVAVATQVSSASLISRATLTRWLAKDFGVEDVEQEIALIAAQPVINPFAGF